MKNIFYVQAQAIYDDVVAARDAAAENMAALIEDGEDGDELLKAATAYHAYSDIVRDIEHMELDAKQKK